MKQRHSAEQIVAKLPQIDVERGKRIKLPDVVVYPGQIYCGASTTWGCIQSSGHSPAAANTFALGPAMNPPVVRWIIGRPNRWAVEPVPNQ